MSAVDTAKMIDLIKQEQLMYIVFADFSQFNQLLVPASVPDDRLVAERSAPNRCGRGEWSNR